MWARLMVMIVVSSSLVSAQAVQPQLHRIVALAAEDGMMAMDGDILSVFSDRSIRIQIDHQEWTPADKRDGAISIQLRESHWKQIEKPLPVSTAYGYALCDSFNQIDIGSTEKLLMAALGPTAKVKSIVHLANDLISVVYSTSTNTVRYDIRVALLQRQKTRNYAVLQKDLVTEAGSFCGVQRGEGSTFLVLADEPTGSSDFSVVYVYETTVQRIGK